MSMIVACPSCGSKLRVTEDLLGQRVRCPSCQQAFDAAVVPEPPAPPTPPASGPGLPLQLSLDDLPSPTADQPATPGRGPVGAVELSAEQEPVPARPAPPSGPPARHREKAERDDERRACPACGEYVPRDVRRCYHCGEPIQGRNRDYAPAFVEPHRGGAVLTLGILSLVGILCAPVGLVLGILAWVMGESDLYKIKARTMDRQGFDSTHAGRICGILGTILNALILLAFVALIALAVAEDRSRPSHQAPWPQNQRDEDW